jgi:predicted dehydrogenase
LTNVLKRISYFYAKPTHSGVPYPLQKTVRDVVCMSAHSFSHFTPDSSTGPQLNAGVIGMGFIGEVHIRAIRASGNHVHAISAVTLEEAEIAAANSNVANAMTTKSLMADPNIDVVHICTPNVFHAELAEMAIRNGKHVICEKPLAISKADALRLTNLAREVGVVATVPFIYRFYPSIREARAQIQSSGVSPKLIHGFYLQDWLASISADNWRINPAIGGPSRAFSDIGVHWCDLIEFVSGHKIVRVNAQLLKIFETRGNNTAVSTEDGGCILFQTDKGAQGSLVLNQASAGRKNKLWFSIEGPEYSFVFDQENPDSLWRGGIEVNETYMRGAQDESAGANKYSFLPAGHPQGYQDCFNAFVADTYEAIDGKDIEGLPRFVDGFRASQLTEAVLHSAASQGWVDIK